MAYGYKLDENGFRILDENGFPVLVDLDAEDKPALAPEPVHNAAIRRGARVVGQAFSDNAGNVIENLSREPVVGAVSEALGLTEAPALAVSTVEEAKKRALAADYQQAVAKGQAELETPEATARTLAAKADEAERAGDFATADELRLQVGQMGAALGAGRQFPPPAARGMEEPQRYERVRKDSAIATDLIPSSYGKVAVAFKEGTKDALSTAADVLQVPQKAIGRVAFGVNPKTGKTFTGSEFVRHKLETTGDAGPLVPLLQGLFDSETAGIEGTGMVLEVLTDPLTYTGVGTLSKGGKGAKAIQAAQQAGKELTSIAPDLVDAARRLSAAKEGALLPTVGEQVAAKQRSLVTFAGKGTKDIPGRIGKALHEGESAVAQKLSQVGGTVQGTKVGRAVGRSFRFPSLLPADERWALEAQGFSRREQAAMATRLEQDVLAAQEGIEGARARMDKALLGGRDSVMAEVGEGGSRAELSMRVDDAVKTGVLAPEEGSALLWARNKVDEMADLVRKAGVEVDDLDEATITYFTRSINPEMAKWLQRNIPGKTTAERIGHVLKDAHGQPTAAGAYFRMHRQLEGGLLKAEAVMEERLLEIAAEAGADVSKMPKFFIEDLPTRVYAYGLAAINATSVAKLRTRILENLGKPVSAGEGILWQQRLGIRKALAASLDEMKVADGTASRLVRGLLDGGLKSEALVDIERELGKAASRQEMANGSLAGALYAIEHQRDTLLEGARKLRAEYGWKLDNPLREASVVEKGIEDAARAESRLEKQAQSLQRRSDLLASVGPKTEAVIEANLKAFRKRIGSELRASKADEKTVSLVKLRYPRDPFPGVAAADKKAAQALRAADKAEKMAARLSERLDDLRGRLRGEGDLPMSRVASGLESERLGELAVRKKHSRRVASGMRERLESELEQIKQMTTQFGRFPTAEEVNGMRASYAESARLTEILQQSSGFLDLPARAVGKGAAKAIKRDPEGVVAKSVAALGRSKRTKEVLGGMRSTEVADKLLELEGLPPGMRIVDGHVVTEDVFDFLGTVGKAKQRNEVLQQVIDYVTLHPYNQYWKLWSLNPRPGYHARNWVGGVWSNHLAGDIGYKEYRDADKLLRGSQDEAYAASTFIDLGHEGKVSVADVLRRAADVGADRTTFSSSLDDFAKRLDQMRQGDTPLAGLMERNLDSQVPKFLPEGMQKWQPTERASAAIKAAQEATPALTKAAKKVYSWLPFAPSTVEKNALLKIGAKAGDYVERQQRLAHFIGKLRAGLGDAESGRSVKEFLFDHGDLTDVERNYLTRLFPFWGWMRNNAALQVQQLVKQPGKYAAQIRLAKLADDEEGPDTWMFSENKQGLGVVRLGKMKDGKAASTWLSGWHPAADLLGAAKYMGEGGGVGDQFTSNFTPGFKAALGLAGVQTGGRYTELNPDKSRVVQGTRLPGRTASIVEALLPVLATQIERLNPGEVYGRRANETTGDPGAPPKFNGLGWTGLGVPANVRTRSDVPSAYAWLDVLGVPVRDEDIGQIARDRVKQQIAFITAAKSAAKAEKDPAQQKRLEANIEEQEKVLERMKEAYRRVGIEL